MGYNSPMVPLSRSYFEVQLPIRRKPVEAPAEEQVAQSEQDSSKSE
jgi:hypothetical protein